MAATFPAVATSGTGFGIGANPDFLLNDSTGLSVFAVGSTAPGANTAQVGALFVNTTNAVMYRNTGTVATPAFTTGSAAHAPVAVNATATLTAAQVASGYITSTSAAATTMTFPTGTLLGAALGAAQGLVFKLYVDNTAGASTVTMAVAVNGVLSAAAVANSASFGLLTVPSGTTGTGEFTLVFSSATAYTITRSS